MFAPWTWADAPCGGERSESSCGRRHSTSCTILPRIGAGSSARTSSSRRSRLVSLSPMVPWCSACKDIRHALGDEGHQIIKTVPRRGSVFSLEPSDSGPTSRAATRSGQSIRFLPHPGRRRELAMSIDRPRLAAGAASHMVQSPPNGKHMQSRSDLYRFSRRSLSADPLRWPRQRGLRADRTRNLRWRRSSTTSRQWSMPCALQRYALLGISPGSTELAIAHAVRHPERESKLVLNEQPSRSAATERSSAKRPGSLHRPSLTLMRRG